MAHKVQKSRLIKHFSIDNHHDIRYHYFLYYYHFFPFFIIRMKDANTMNVANCIKRIGFMGLIIASCLCAITPLSANNPEIPADDIAVQQALKEQQDFCEMVLRERREECKALNRILEDLLLMANGRAFTMKNKQESIANIKQLKEFINSILNEGFVQIDPQGVYFLGHITKSIMHHIIHALDNNMQEFPLFEIETVLKRHAPRADLGPEEIHADLMKSKQILAKLMEKAKSAGLRWYNKIYRTLDYYVIQPSAKYSLHTRAAKGALATLAFFGCLWVTEAQLPWIRESSVINLGFGLGWPVEYKNNAIDRGWEAGGPYITDTGKTVEIPAHPIRWLGKLQHLLFKNSNGQSYVIASLVGAAGFAWKSEGTTFLNFAKHKLDHMHNKMRGGTFAEKPEVKFMFNPRVTFKDLVGLNKAKEDLMFIIKYLEDPERFDRAKLTPEKGYILTGPTRTGKSYIAEALAGEIKEMYKRQGKNPDDFNFFNLPASFILSDGIDQIIARAKQYAPCILFVDEIDLLGLQRAGGNPQLLSSFLSSMSGVLESDPDKVIIMIAATNKPENLDQALLQPGRFGKEIRFEYPPFEDRKELLIRRIGALADINSFDIDMLARETENQSYEKINMIIRYAFQRGIMRGETLTQQSLEKCLDEEVRHIIPNHAAEPSDAEKELIAAHQAGRALTVMLINGKEKLAKVTINPYLTSLAEEAVWEHFYKNKENTQKKIQYGKIWTKHEVDIKDLHSLEDKIAQCKIQLAGFAAEEILLGACGYSYHRDAAESAFEITKSIVSEGINLNNMTNKIKEGYEAQALELNKKYANEVKQLLTKHKDKLKKLADALLKENTLTGDAAARIVGLAPTPVAAPAA